MDNLKAYLKFRSEEISNTITEYKKFLVNFITDKDIPIKERYEIWSLIDDVFKEHEIWMHSGTSLTEPFFESWHEHLKRYDTIHLSDRISEFYDKNTGEINFEFIMAEVFEFETEDDAKIAVFELLEYVLSKNLKSYVYDWWWY